MRVPIRLSILFIFLLFISTVANAVPKLTPDDGNGTLTGTVTDKADGTPIIGATVSVPDLKNGSITDVNGHYTLTNLPKGIYLVQVSYIGYGTFNQRVDFGKTTKLDVQ